MNAASDVSSMIDARGVRKHYRLGNGGLVEILAGVDLQVRVGEIIALRGPSGSGKSTLLNILGCLDRPSAGRYELGGREVSALGRAEQAWVRLHYVGFVFQSFNLIPRATALENVALPLYYAGVSRNRREEQARALLAAVGLEPYTAHLPSELSGGQCQRVAIARALACSPKLLLADEPTGSLDSRTGADVLGLLRGLQANQKITVVLVTHDPSVAAIADRQVHLLDGRIVEGDPRPA